MTLEVDGVDTIKAVKRKIEAEEGVPCDQQRLFLAEQELQDSRTVEECGIQDGSTLRWDKLSRFVTIFVKTPAGRGSPVYCLRRSMAKDSFAGLFVLCAEACMGLK